MCKTKNKVKKEALTKNLLSEIEQIKTSIENIEETITMYTNTLHKLNEELENKKQELSSL